MLNRNGLAASVAKSAEKIRLPKSLFRALYSAAMLVPAPGLLVMMMGRPSVADIDSAIVRATMSEPPPAA
ncbi:hypothetical protein D3C87_1891810 [compost metagenome]